MGFIVLITSVFCVSDPELGVLYTLCTSSHLNLTQRQGERFSYHHHLEDENIETTGKLKELPKFNQSGVAEVRGSIMEGLRAWPWTSVHMSDPSDVPC